jgi:hypothetical protein
MAEQIISPGVFQIETDQSIYTQQPQEMGAAIVGPTVSGRPLVPTYVTTYSQFQSLFGEQFKSGSYYYEYFTSQAAKEYFSNGGKTLLVTRIISGSSGISTYATSNVPALVGTGSSFQLEALSWGAQMNNTSSMSSGSLDSGSMFNVRWEVTAVNSGSGTFTLTVRRGDDNNNTKNILETWANMSLDPQQSNYIARVIGDLKPVYVAATGGSSAYVNFSGSYSNKSQYVRVSAVTTPQVDSIDNNGAYKATQYSGSLPAVGSGSYGGSFSGGVADTTAVKQMNENIGTGAGYITGSTGNIQGFGTADYALAFNLLTNKDEYQFNVLLAPGAGLDSAAAATMISTAEGRGDAIAITDAGIYGTAIATAAQKRARCGRHIGTTHQGARDLQGPG